MFAWILAQVSCCSANFNFTCKMQIGRIKNIPFIYKTIIEIVMAAAEMVLKASDVVILEFLMWRPVRPKSTIINCAAVTFAVSFYFFFNRNTLAVAVLYLQFMKKAASCVVLFFLSWIEQLVTRKVESIWSAKCCHKFLSYQFDNYLFWAEIEAVIDR